MLYQNEANASAFDRLLTELSRPGCDAPDLARRMLKIDPTFAPAYSTLAMQQHESGDLDQAEALMWKALELWPGSYHFYTPLASIRMERHKGDGLAADLHHLGVWKLSMMEKIPEHVAEQFREIVTPFGDPSDPETYETMATVLEVTRKKSSDAGPIDERLSPYVLLNDLQRSASSVVAFDTVRGIIEKSDECVPLLRAALRLWARGTDGLTDKAACMITALLGEIGGPGILEELLEIAEDTRLFLHVHWAIHRIAKREPEVALAAFRAATPKTSLGMRCGLAEQMGLMDPIPGIEDAIAALVDHFSSLSRKQDAPHLVLAVNAALTKFGSEGRARSILGRCSAMLSKKDRAYVQDTLEEGFVPTLVLESIEGLDIDDVCLERVLMDDEKEEEAEEDRQDFEEEDEDEEEALPLRGHANSKTPNLMSDISEYALTLYSDADQKQAKKLYFGTSGKVEIDPAEVETFLQWLIHDYRSRGSRQSTLDRYRRDRESVLNPRERLFVDSLRGARFGLWEVQHVETGQGVQIENLFTGDDLFVHDVSSSRSLVRWDCLLTRVQDFEGEMLFVGNGVFVPRDLLGEFRRWIEDESRAAGQTEDEFVRANSHRLHRMVYEIHGTRRDNLKIVNREGETFEFARANYQVLDESALLAKLRALEDLREEPDSEEPDAYHFGWLEVGGDKDMRASYGHVAIRDGRLRLESNSRKRLQRGRRMLERQAKGCLKHLGDSFESVQSAMKRLEGEKPAEQPKSIPPEVQRELIGQMKTRHYATWPDEKLPALEGKTPREAVRTSAGRRAVLDLIRMMENGEARRAKEGDAAFDFTPLRKELGLEED